MTEEAELAAHRLKEVAPLGVVGGAEFQLDGIVRLDRDGGVGDHGDRRSLVVVDEERGDAVDEGITIVSGVTGVGGGTGDTGHQQMRSARGGERSGQRMEAQGARPRWAA